MHNHVLTLIPLFVRQRSVLLRHELLQSINPLAVQLHHCNMHEKI